jgi:pimeloyl-ACP methyl ester carboxylesterase
MPEITTGQAEVNGTTLYYEVAGTGFPLVLLHAEISDHRMWDDHFAALAEQYRVLRYDFRGFGKSGRYTGLYSDVDDLHALLTQLGIERAHLLGVSMGGNVAINFCLQHPATVASLTLVSSALGGFTGYTQFTAEIAGDIDRVIKAKDMLTAVEMTLRMWVDGPSRTGKAVDPNTRIRLQRILSENAHTFTAPELDVKPDPPPIQRLGEITAPTLIMVGDKDLPDILKIADVLLQGIPANVEKLVIPNVAHMLPMEIPAEFTEIVLTFLKDRR